MFKVSSIFVCPRYLATIVIFAPLLIKSDTMAVYSFKNAVDNNYDLLTFLPILSAYLGHKDIYATEKYLHLVSDMYPDIRNKIECYDNFKVKVFNNE